VGYLCNLTNELGIPLTVRITDDDDINLHPRDIPKGIGTC
jgi:hypothetical protein